MAKDIKKGSSPFKASIYVAIGAILLSYLLLAVPFFPDLETVVISASNPLPFEGPFARNALLDQAVKLPFDLPGAECIVPVDDTLVTGLLDGRVVQIKGDQVKTIVECDQVKPCGRPLGLRYDDTTKDLYVADSIRGLFKVNLRSGTRTLLSPPSIPVDGKVSLLTDDLTVTREGDIYFTDASTKWGFDYLHLDFAEGTPNGRVLHYDPRTNSTQLLLKDLHFPNGIQLSPEEDYFLLCETARLRILKYYLRGPQKGQLKVVVDNLPGYPDNIRPSGRGTYWVGLPMLRVAGHTSLSDLLGPHPRLRKAITRLPYLVALLFKMPDLIIPSQRTYDRALSVVNWFESEYGGGPTFGCVFEIDQNGVVIRSLQAFNSSISKLSIAFEHKGILYLGSPWSEGIHALKLP